MLLGIAFEEENIAFIATIPMVVSASVTFPILFLSLFWSGFTTRGAIAGAVVGLVSSVVLIVLGPRVWVSVLGHAEALFPYDYPALFTMPASVLVMILMSKADRSARGLRIATTTPNCQLNPSLVRLAEVGHERSGPGSVPSGWAICCHRPEGYTQEIDNVLLIPGVPGLSKCPSVRSNAGGGWVRDQDL